MLIIGDSSRWLAYPIMLRNSLLTEGRIRQVSVLWIQYVMWGLTKMRTQITLKHNCNVMMSLHPGQLSLRCKRNFHRCTGTGIIPTMLIDMLNHPEFSTFDLSHLEMVATGGSPIPLELLRRANSELPNTKITVSSLGERCKVQLELLPRC